MHQLTALRCQLLRPVSELESIEVERHRSPFLFKGEAADAYYTCCSARGANLECRQAGRGRCSGRWVWMAVTRQVVFKVYAVMNDPAALTTVKLRVSFSCAVACFPWNLGEEYQRGGVHGSE